MINKTNAAVIIDGPDGEFISNEANKPTITDNNPPITESSTLNITLLELVREVNLLQSQNLKLLQDIRDATNFADLKIRIDQK